MSAASRNLCLILLGLALAVVSTGAAAQPLEETLPITLTAPSLILTEAETGAVIFEKDADAKRPVASVTKLMTLLLVFEKLQSGEIALSDTVTVSKNAAEATGSQAFLDANTAYPLETLLKSAIIASANDSATALAEFMGGTEEAFAAMMNERAQALGMKNTCYKNCTGLPAEGQYTTARDVAILSCEIAKHEDYFLYSKVWLSTLTHPSGRVTDLTNTNRLVRFYTDCDGLKTGSTAEAKYCISATAKRKNMRLIAVVLGASGSQVRFDEARNMLDYGFANYAKEQIARAGDLTGYQADVKNGSVDKVDVALGKGLSLLLKNNQASQLSIEVVLPEFVEAPIAAGQTIGSVNVLLSGTVIARLPAVAAQEVRMPGMTEGFLRLFENWR